MSTNFRTKGFVYNLIELQFALPLPTMTSTEADKDGRQGNASPYGKDFPETIDKAEQLATLILAEPYRFGLQGDDELALTSQKALKALFDFCESLWMYL